MTLGSPPLLPHILLCPSPGAKGGELLLQLPVWVHFHVSGGVDRGLGDMKGEKNLNSIQIQSYFKCWCSFLICLQWFLFQGFQILVPCILSRFSYCIQCKSKSKLSLLHFLKFIYFLTIFKCLFILREKARAEKGQRRRENPKQAPHICMEPHMGLEPTNCEIMTWAKIKCQTA